MSKGRPFRTRSPQEKKRLGLTKDHRNSYGNSDKAARKSIPLRKALERRRRRHRAEQDTSALPRADELLADSLESSIRAEVHRAGGWTKGPDIPLGDWIAGQAGAAQGRALRRSGRRRRTEDPPEG